MYRISIHKYHDMQNLVKKYHDTTFLTLKASKNYIFFPRDHTKGRIMCNWLKSIGDWKSIGKFFDKNSEIFLQFTLLVVNHVDWVKSIAINETQLELP